MEKDIERYMRKEIEKMGGMFLKWVSPGNDGVPDRIVILPGGEIVFIELKDDGGKVSQLQEWWIVRLRESGCFARVVRGMDEARDAIRIMRASVPVAPEDVPAFNDPWRTDK